MGALFVLGRVIFGGFFAYNGVNHFLHQKAMSQYAESKGVPAVESAVPATGALLLAGGASIMAGLKPRHGLAAVISFLIPVTFQMHRFWEEQDPNQRMTEFVNFSKNLALVGAALMMLKIDEPWPGSMPQLRGQEEEMFVRLGGRELRALPA
jgi:putative oxidoreductase